MSLAIIAESILAGYAKQGAAKLRVVLDEATEAARNARAAKELAEATGLPLPVALSVYSATTEYASKIAAVCDVPADMLAEQIIGLVEWLVFLEVEPHE